MQDKTVQVPGGDGTFYFGSYYTQRQFNVSFAFDDLTEQDIEVIRRHFGDKKIHNLIFDECPYKIYSAKVTGTATIKYLAFNEGEGRERVYKGEGSIQFTCYNPFARSNFKFIDSSVQTNYPNYNEWILASGMMQSQGNFDKAHENEYKLYNPGVKESDFIYVYDNLPSNGGVVLCDKIGTIIKKLYWKNLNKKEGDSGFVINSKTGLISGALSDNGAQLSYENYKLTNNIYNDAIIEGDFFKIPITTTAFNDAPYFQVLQKNNLGEYTEVNINNGNMGLIYDYYYL